MLRHEQQKLYKTLALLTLKLVNIIYTTKKEILVSNNVKNQPLHFVVTATLQLWLKVLSYLDLFDRNGTRRSQM